MKLEDRKKKRTIKIFLGGNCNMQCKYCIQGKIDRDKISDIKPNFNKIKKFLLKQQPMEVFLWGGEPLLYWEIIKDSINKINSYLGKNNIRFGFTTNGLMLTDDKINFINDNNIDLILSYDGVTPNLLRNIVPSEKILSIYNKANNKFISAVISAENPNYGDNFNWLMNKFPTSSIYIADFRILSEKTDKKFYNFKDEDIDKSAKSLFEFAIDCYKNKKKISGKTIGKISMIINMITNLSNKEKIPRLICRLGLIQYAIDLNGNFYSCYNKDEIIGNINEDLSIINEKYFKIAKSNKPTGCQNCIVKDYCLQNSCVSSIWKDKQHTEFLHCEYRKKFILAYIKYYNIYKNELLEFFKYYNKSK